MSDEEAAEVRTIAADQQKKTRRALVNSRNKTFAIHNITVLQGKVDDLADRVKRRVRFDCQPGCSYCCSMRIDAFAPEVFRIARHVRGLPEAERVELMAKLEAHAPQAAGVSMNDFYLTCPMLKDSRCSIYSLRPTMCRKYLSLDVEACKTDESIGPEDSEMVLKSAALIFGTVEGYKAAKLPAEAHELGQAVLRAVHDPSLEDRWYEGEEVFDPLP